jgi:hypothetical protein
MQVLLHREHTETNDLVLWEPCKTHIYYLWAKFLNDEGK